MNAMHLAVLIDAATSLRGVKNMSVTGFKYTEDSLVNSIKAAVLELEGIDLRLEDSADSERHE